MPHDVVGCGSPKHFVLEGFQPLKWNMQMGLLFNFNGGATSAQNHYRVKDFS